LLGAVKVKTIVLKVAPSTNINLTSVSVSFFQQLRNGGADPAEALKLFLSMSQAVLEVPAYRTAFYISVRPFISSVPGRLSAAAFAASIGSLLRGNFVLVLCSAVDQLLDNPRREG
jgi:hypothetical protein